MNTFQKIGLAMGGLFSAVAPQANAAAALHDGTFAGGTFDAYFGPVQVEITVSGGKITDAQALQYPNHRRTSVSINNEALPYLQEELVQAQSARIDLVSGATLTSRAYIASVADAIKKAQK